MRPADPFAQLPSWWIEEGKLGEFRWEKGRGGDTIAALIALLVIAHNCGRGLSCRLTYDQICKAGAGISREKLANGLTILRDLGIITGGATRSDFNLVPSPKGTWCKLPSRPLYSQRGVIAFLEDFRLRNRAELNALKLLFLFASRRDRDTNYAEISYNKIAAYSGIDKGRIRAGITVLVHSGLVHMDRVASFENFAAMNRYRLAHVESYTHHNDADLLFRLPRQDWGE